MFIPEKIHVGYQQRQGTYTSKLGFITYTKHDGTLKQKNSWENWRDTTIEPDIFDNTPVEGFVLNENGGGKHSYGYWDRAEFVRVWDPR